MNFTINIHAIEDSFSSIAEKLMNNHVIQVKDIYYRIVDCEFYFYHKNHQDNYAHRHPEQIKNGSWYFHGSGIDITIGNENENAKGGILIRGIAKLAQNQNPNGDFIEVDNRTIGPLNVLTSIFSNYANVFDTDNCFYLIQNENVIGFTIDKAKVFKCPRKGLNKIEDDKSFHDKPYRFISFPYLPHSEKGKIEEYLVEESKLLSKPLAKELFTLKYAKRQ